MSFTKSSGSYYWKEARVWLEAFQSGILPAWIGDLNGAIELPSSPEPDFIRQLCSGRNFLPHIQQNRVGLYEWTATWSKSVSIWALAMVPPSKWAGRLSVLDRIVRDETEHLLGSLSINSLAQGTSKERARGVAFALNHVSSFRGEPNAHCHVGIPNLAATADGRIRSIANVRETLYLTQRLRRVRCNKLLDDQLQARGYATVRAGSRVELANIPKALVVELSSTRAAMDEAQQSSGFTSAKANQFYARMARRQFGERCQTSPAEAFRRWNAIVREHGVKNQHLKSNVQPRTARIERETAQSVAKSSIKACVKTLRVFSIEQIREKVYTLGIGRPVTLSSLEQKVNRIIREPEKFGLKSYTVAGRLYFATQRDFRKAKAQESEAFVKNLDQVKERISTFGKHVSVATPEHAEDVVNKLARWMRPLRRIRVIDGSQADRFLASHEPTGYLRAHALAIWRGLLSPGNPHDRALYAERIFAKLRSHKKLSEHTVLVVTRSSFAHPNDLERIRRIAKRDKSSVVLSDYERILPDPTQAIRAQKKQRDRSMSFEL